MINLTRSGRSTDGIIRENGEVKSKLRLVFLEDFDGGLSLKEVASYLSCSKAHIKNMGANWDGPAFVIVDGKRRYTGNAVLEYEDYQQHHREICSEQ